MKHIIISRTDSIGDCVLTLPLCGYLKRIYPETKISYLGKSYVKDIVYICNHVDTFVEYKENESIESNTELLKNCNADCIIHVFPRPELAKAAKKAGIKYRVGTTGRLYHLLNCNKLARFSRKKSELHESQLNFKLLKALNVDYMPDLKEISGMYGLNISAKNQTGKVILHPGSRGSAVNWDINHYKSLSDILKASGKTVYITGTEEEGKSFREYFEFNSQLIDMTGKLSLAELVVFISETEALIACSTGPLHIAAALGVKAIGLYVDIKPIHPGRWKPVGRNATYLIPKNFTNINMITPEVVAKHV